MADWTVYVAGASEEQVREAVEAWAETADPHSWDVEEADEYPGYSVAVDLYAPDEATVRRAGQSLIDYLPFPASTEVDMEVNRTGRHLRGV